MLQPRPKSEMLFGKPFRRRSSRRRLFSFNVWSRLVFRIREYTFTSVVAARLVRTTENRADMFTKVLDRGPFLKFRRIVLNPIDSVVACVSAVIGGIWAPT